MNNQKHEYWFRIWILVGKAKRFKEFMVMQIHEDRNGYKSMVPFHVIWFLSFFFIISGERAKIWRLSKSTSRQSAYTTMIGEWCDVQKAVTIREWNKCNAFVFTIKIEWNDPIILGSSSGSLIKFYGIAHLTATVHGRASQHPKPHGNVNLIFQK